MQYDYAISSQFIGITTTKSPRRTTYMSLPGILKSATDLGYSGVEHTHSISRAKEGDVEAHYLRAVREAVGETGCEVVGFYNLFEKIPNIRPHKIRWSIFSKSREGNKLVRQTLEFYAELLTCCAAAGGTYVVHNDPESRMLHAGWEFSDGFERAIDFFEEPNVIMPYGGRISLVDYANILGIRIAIQPTSVEGAFINTVEEALIFADKFNNPAIGISLDTAAMYAEAERGGKSVAEIIESIPGEHVDKVMAVQFTTPDGFAPGLGPEPRMDFKPILQALDGLGYNGLISIVPSKLDIHAEATYVGNCRATLEHLRSLEGELTH